jgi:hypothetical protein
MAAVSRPTKPVAVFEDFSSLTGEIVIIEPGGKALRLAKSAEATFAEPATLYRGHSFNDVLASDHDLLGNEILAQPKDPSFADIAPCLVPITKIDLYSFMGTRENPDKISVAYGGRTGNFDPAVFIPEIARIRTEGKVFDGLVGGWLPVLRFVYPEKEGVWSECVMFAPQRVDNQNPRIQPAWYRVARIENHALKWVKYFDSYVPNLSRTASGDSANFFRDLLALSEGWEREFQPLLKLEIPDQRLAALSRHSLVRAMITRIGSFPKYGVLDRNYGGPEHDGFQDTFNVDTTAMLEWGLFDRAREIIDNYFAHFVRNDGALLYRGPETGQYGRMLTVVADYFRRTKDAELLLKHEARIHAVARLLLGLHHEALALPTEHVAHGMIAGWCEADSCLEPEPERYFQPYFSNSTEASRGFIDLGSVWEAIGRTRHRADLETWGQSLRHEGVALRADLETSLQRSLLKDVQPESYPAIAGAKEPFDVASRRDPRDPQYRAYRTYMEMLFSGCLTTEQVQTIVAYREAHRDIVLGVPTAYGYGSREMAGFLSYGHAYGLLQHDLVREFLLELYSLSAHQYTRGTWTAPETRLIDPSKTAAPYCVPAQLSVPLLLRWMIAFEDPNAETLYLFKATPLDWLADGQRFAATEIPTRWGRVGVEVESHLALRRIDATVQLPASESPHETVLRLRVPPTRKMTGVTVDGRPWTQFDAVQETIVLPASLRGKIAIVVSYDR